MAGQWCDRHWQPYQEGRASGIVASVLLMQYTVNDERFMRKCGYDPAEGKLADASPKSMNQAIDEVTEEYGGLCCFLGDAKMDEILHKAMRTPAERQALMDDADPHE